MAVSEMAVRGSAKLAERLAAKGAAITSDDIKAAIGVPVNVDVRLLRWLTKGIPPVIEIAATVECKQENVGEVVQRIMNTAEFQGVEVFPYGIPRPDIALINFTNVPEEFGG
ncbi:MAG TPA: hypothetical protein VF133_17345 [Terriglobales bacterium]